MATCKRVEPEHVPPPVEYQLTIDAVEAGLLTQLLYSHVAGPASEPLRAIGHALRGAGARSTGHTIIQLGSYPADDVLQVGYTE